jgi:hypothetical protein
MRLSRVFASGAGRVILMRLIIHTTTAESHNYDENHHLRGTA